MDIKAMPHSNEAEVSLLGNFMLYEDAIGLAAEGGLESNDFYSERHQYIYRAMVEMHNSGLSVDAVTVINRLKDYGILEKAGGTEYIASLQDAATGNSFTEEYIKVIRDKSTARKVISVGKQITDEGFDGKNDINTLMDFAEKMVLDVTRNRFTSDFRDTPSVLDEVINNIKAVQAGSVEAGIKTNYSDLDYYTNGFQRGDFIILAARPSVGKTAFALNLALNVASATRGSSEAVAIFSLEMGADQLIRRMLTARSKVVGEKIRKGQLSNDDWNRIIQATNQLKEEKIYIDDTSGIKVSEIFSKCRKLKQKEGLSLVVIDYIQLIQGSSKGSAESRQLEVSEISRSLKILARELNVPVIALSQLSRGVEQRADKHPLLSDLRESGSLEQDADMVMFLYREAYHDKEHEEENNQVVEVNIAKHRNGPTGTVKLSFQKDINAFFGIIDTASIPN